MSDNPNKLVELKGDEKALLVERRATCPFIGSAVAQGELSVRNNAEGPLDTSIVVRQVKYLNNIVEQDHRAVKQIT